MPDNRIDDLRRRVDADPTSIAFAALAEEYRRIGKFQDAVDVCRRGLERHPAYLSAKVTLARALIELKQLDQAQRELDDVLRIAPENLAAIRARADVHHRRGLLPETFDFEAAHAEFHRETASNEPPTAEPPTTETPAADTPTAERPTEAEVDQTPIAHETRAAASQPDVATKEVERLEAFLLAIVAERRRREAPGA
jgi:tetratricopeptide (TPR) repeat protein